MGLNKSSVEYMPKHLKTITVGRT